MSQKSNRKISNIRGDARYWKALDRRESIQRIVLRKGADVLGIEGLRYVAEAIRFIVASVYGTVLVTADAVTARLIDWISQYAPQGFSPNAIEAAVTTTMRGLPKLASNEEVGEAFEIAEYSAWKLKSINDRLRPEGMRAAEQARSV